MIGVQLVSETVLDRGRFFAASKAVTGENHITGVDKNPGMSRLSDDDKILQHFSDLDVDLTTCITYVGFLVAGLDEVMDEFISYTRGMPHLPTSRVMRGTRAVVIVGSLDQWRAATLEGCNAPGPVRQSFNEVYRALVQKGFSGLFQGFKTRQVGKQFLLEKK